MTAFFVYDLPLTLSSCVIHEKQDWEACLSITRTIACGVLSLCITLPVMQVRAYQLPAAELDKLSAAQRLAARVFQETQDANGAVKVLEEAGVQRLEKGRPANMTAKVYLDLIEAYGSYLARIPGSGDAAVQYLKKVIKADPARATAYLSLGELYYRRFHTAGDPQYRRIYRGAFEKYVERLRAAGGRAELPQTVLESVYPHVNDICLLVRQLNEERHLPDLDLFFNPERDVIEMDQSDPEGIQSRLGASFDGFLQAVQGPVTQSTVDIDNDRQDEMRFSAATGDGCRRNVFYKKFGEQTALLSNALLDEYYRGTRVCAGGSLHIARVKGINYIVEQQRRGDQTDLQVFELRPSGEYVQHCRISPATVLERNLVTDCQASICKYLAGRINKIVAADGQAGSEWLVSDISTQKFAADVLSDPGLQLFVTSPHQYLADLDNDGEKELIARLWRTLPDGKLEYQYRLFKMQDGVWQPWNLPVPDTGMGPGPWQWFFVESFENSQYIVAYTASKNQDAAARPVTVYSLVVYQLQNGELKRIGELRTQQPRQTVGAEGEAQTVNQR